MALTWPDYVALALYFVIVLGVGFWASCRAKTDTATGYFLAGRTMTWIPIGASTFATNIGAPMFVGLAGSAAASGISVVMFEWHAMLMLILLGWLFLPVYMSSGCYTMPQYLQLRYGGQRIRVWYALVHTFLTIISQLAGQIYAGGLFIQKIFEWDLYASVGLIVLVTAVYTVIGGLTAVIWTDTIQTVILVIGSVILGVMSLVRVGGFESMRERYMTSAANYTYIDNSLYGNHTCGLPRDDSFHIFRAPDADYPWPGMVGGLTVLALNAWCTDQICVQRSLSAKNVSHAKAGVLLAAYLKVFPFLFFIIPGMISRVLYPDEVACADPVTCKEVCDNPSGCSNIAYPLLVLRILPDGVRGIMLAALLAALMSSLTSIFNSSSTVFTMDIWKRFRPGSQEAELMVVGRVYTLFLAAVGVLWLPILTAVQGSQFWNYSQSIGSYILPPIVMVFLLGIFWTRATEQGAFAGLVIGFAIGIVRMGLSWSRTAPDCGSGEVDRQFKIVSEVHYLYFAMILSAIVVMVVVCISLVTTPRPPVKLRKRTFWTRNDPLLPVDSEDEDDDEGEEKSVAPPSPEPGVQVETPLTCSDKLLKVFCGVDEESLHELSRDERIQLQLRMTNIKENPFWRKVLNINAIICAGVSVFLHAFWA